MSFADYLNACNHQVTVITANQRLSAYLQHQFNCQQKKSGLTVWATPDILPLKAWLTRTFAQLSTDLLLLTEQQTLLLWQRIMSETTESAGDWPLLNPAGMAHSVQEAWSLLKQWQIPLSQLMQYATDDTQLLYQWIKRFTQVCDEKGWLVLANCPDMLMEKLKTRQIELPGHIILAGFDEIPLQIQQLCTVISQYSELHYYHCQVEHAVAYQCAVTDEQAELYAMARWALAEFIDNPAQQIACVVPQLDSLRTQVERIFQEVFADTTVAGAINISGGRPLAQYPLIHAALTVWRLAAAAWIDLEQMSQLLRSPFLVGAEQEMTRRAQWDISLRNQGEPQLSLAELLKQVDGSNCPMFAAGLMQLAQTLTSGEKKPLQQWAVYFAQQLQLMGWPGERPLNSAEYQQVERLYALLQEFAGLGTAFPATISVEEAVHELQQLAQRTVFQPKSTQVTIQVLGVLEAVGLTFDRLWVMGMNDDLWPLPASPNPFIPLRLQRHYNLPHSSAERELSFYRKLTQRFATSASTVVFSYSQQRLDMELRPSPLIQQFQPLSLPLTAPDSASESAAMEVCNDQQAPPVPEHAVIRGGASILRDQAACPFRAFARFRLGARKLPVVVSGLSPQERGIYLHDILEKIWGMLDNQQQLCSYSPEQLTQLIATLTGQVLTNKARQRRLLRQKKFFALEQQRLTQLIYNWLLLEKQRPAFRVIAREIAREVQLGRLTLVLRTDREDELADGSRIIIDYKTGQTHIRAWFGERPDDPQLPLYCLTSAYPLHGIVYATIRADGLQWQGVSEDDYAITGVVTLDAQAIDPTIKSWEAFKTSRQHALLHLADEFLNGQAQVAPKEGSKTCEQCDLQLLCRIHNN